MVFDCCLAMVITSKFDGLAKISGSNAAEGAWKTASTHRYLTI